MTEWASGAPVSADPSFDRYARMVRRSLAVPVALVSIVEADRQIFPGAVGLPAQYDQCRFTPLSHSFCQYVVIDEAPLIITDARTDERLRTNLAIEDLNVIAYAGWPITDHTGGIIGSLCAIDDQPREWSAAEVDALADLAASCSAEISQRELRRMATESEQAAVHSAARFQALLQFSEALSDTRSISDIAAALLDVAQNNLGCVRAGIWLRAAGALASHERINARTLERLTYAEHPKVDWPLAHRRSELVADRTNPVGGALARRRMIFFANRAAQDEAFPQLAPLTNSSDGDARLFAPLTVGPDSFGTMVLLWAGQHQLTAEDHASISALSSYTAQAVQRAALLAERTETAAALQQAMLTELPQPDHLELAARYRPAAAANQVGGDWYDAVVMPSGHTNLMIGDVAGHDIHAAAVMGQLRSTLRAFAWALDESPAENVTRLDRVMADLGISTMASLIFARIEQPAEQLRRGTHVLRFTNAGHLPPLLVHDGEADYLPARPDYFIGVDVDAQRHDHVAEIPAGGLVLLYTDGLIERRGESISDGMDRLRATAAGLTTSNAEAFLDELLESLLPESSADDVAALAVRFAPTT